jgi:hypothetical protein
MVGIGQVSNYAGSRSNGTARRRFVGQDLRRGVAAP